MNEFGDFSHHRAVDVRDYFSRGYDGIAWKITEGTGYEDPTWADAYRIARDLKKRFIGYHFDRAKFAGNLQWDFFMSRWLAVAGSLRPGLDRPCLDSEDTDTPSLAAASAAAFTRRAVERGCATGWLYTGKWFADPNGIVLDHLPPGWRNGWLSDYTAGQADGAVELPAGWRLEQVVARQYTSTHEWPGQPAGVDFSRMLRPEVEADMPLTDQDVTKVADAVWAKMAAGLSDKAHSYLPPLHTKLGDVTNPAPDSVFGRLRTLSAQTSAGVDPAALKAAVADAVRAVLREGVGNA